MVLLMLLFCFVFLAYAVVFFSKQKTAYEMRISDWSSDVCSSDLLNAFFLLLDRPETYNLPMAPSRPAERIAPAFGTGLAVFAGLAVAAAGLLPSSAGRHRGRWYRTARSSREGVTPATAPTGATATTGSHHSNQTPGTGTWVA